MALQPVLVYPDARLKQVSETVTEFDDGLASIVNDLMQTMDDGPPSVGIAAPQVACCKRICIVDVKCGRFFDPTLRAQASADRHVYSCDRHLCHHRRLPDPGREP